MNRMEKKDKSFNNSRSLLFSSIIEISSFSLIIGCVLRIVLLFTGNVEIEFTVEEWLKIFLLGALNDLSFSVIACVFIAYNLLFVFESKYKKPWGYIIWGTFILLFSYVLFFNTIFHEYGSVVPKIVLSLLLYKVISFGIRLFFPQTRRTWSFIIYIALIFLYIASILLFVAVGEFLFWHEFSVRYNFIAVDYLIYTNEVIGNIKESYPVIPLLISLVILSAIITYFMIKNTKKYFYRTTSLKQKLVTYIGYLSLTGLAVLLISFNMRFQNTENTYVNELQANGSVKFCNAFMSSQLDFNDFYPLLPKDEAIHILNSQYNSIGIKNNKTIKDSLPELHKNIVLITVESLSASFLSYFGNTQGITPSLDSLGQQSLFFTHLFATGNRTVRGLEALTLSRPPCSGESIIKQPNNANLFSTAQILKDRGYTIQYFYGGDSYFDNMKTFFGGNGYEIIDRKNFTKEEITFSNIWGVCDEDMYNKALKTFDKDYELKKPFFGHIMTISNHRPFTYPEGKIDIATNSKSRMAGVKYTDYALGQFINQAKSKAWFNNTVFVIVADHCASSAGKTDIPIEGYHIPAMIYAPEFIEPKIEHHLVSQIDLMPTLFGLLNFSYDSVFFGQDIYSSDFDERAFIATYQNLGYLKNNVLTILSPGRKIKQFKVLNSENYKYDLIPVFSPDSILVREAIANYQMTSYQ